MKSLQTHSFLGRLAWEQCNITVSWLNATPSLARHAIRSKDSYSIHYYYACYYFFHFSGIDDVVCIYLFIYALHWCIFVFDTVSWQWKRSVGSKTGVKTREIDWFFSIQIAVDNENVELVEFLLKQDGVKIGDALLYAVREGVYRIVEMLIDHPSISREMLGKEWSDRQRAETEESSDYSPDVSPVILAAQCNQFEILQLLLSRGARVVKPHSLSCGCQRCKQVGKGSTCWFSLCV